MKADAKQKLTGTLCVAAGAALWGIIGLFTRRLNELGLASMQIVAVRLAGAGALMSAYYLVRGRKAFAIAPRDIWMFIGTGVCSFVFFNWCYFSCMEASSLAAAAVLLYTAPCFVLIISALLFHEAFTRAKLAALAATTVGCALVTGVMSSGGITPRVALLGLGSGFFYALYSIFGRVALRKYSSEQVALWTNICGGIGALLLVDIPQLAAKAAQPQAVLPALLLIICSTIAPLLLYTKGLERLETARASIIATLEPVVAAAVGVAVLHETITAWQIAGILLVLGGVALASRDG